MHHWEWITTMSETLWSKGSDLQRQDLRRVLTVKPHRLETTLPAINHHLSQLFISSYELACILGGSVPRKESTVGMQKYMSKDIGPQSANVFVGQRAKKLLDAIIQSLVFPFSEVTV